MSRAQQPSIRSFFTPRPSPSSDAPPPPPPPPPPQPPQPPQPLQQQHYPTIGEPLALPDPLPTLPSPPALHPQARIEPITAQHIPALRRINSLLLPVLYPDSFYARILEPLSSGLFSRAILWRDHGDDDEDDAAAAAAPKVIGGVICRLEPNPFLDPATGRPTSYDHTAHMMQQQRPPPAPPLPNQQSPPGQLHPATPYHAIYIQSLTLLSPYRSLGLAAAALEHIVASAALLCAVPAPGSGRPVDVRAVYAHVWTENPEGLRWYGARGFVREGGAPQAGYYFKLRPDTAWVVRRDVGAGAVVGATTAFVGGPIAAAATAAKEQASTSGGAASAARGGLMTDVVNLPPLRDGATPTSLARHSSSPSVPATLQPSGTAAPTQLRPSPTPSVSFQKARPDMEWNDLPAEMMTAGGGGGGSGGGPNLLAAPGSGASSRSTSSVRKKKDRSYPAAAFGS
ncbi:hypothetical protein P8C59_009430 [Phyllachora maydis]|uniref:N-acetyltransferase domain-containing protein n=1 Tax=Phyllachora maydis TaxID=1825666 RepID=A0AAD9ICH3_9PEZI|nr:hypothetical protein P8C59_009430 [Phyllachora maydis]